MGKLRVTAQPLGTKNGQVNYYHNGVYIGCSWLNGTLFRRSGALRDFIKEHGL